MVEGTGYARPVASDLDLRGVWIPLITPFAADGKVDAAAIERLCTEYLDAVGSAETPGDDIAYGFATLRDGTAIAPIMRSVYREAVLRADEGAPEPPPLLGADVAAVRTWFSDPARPGGRVGRLLDGIWRSRPDLQGAFPDPEGRSGDHFIAWALDQAEAQTGIPVGYLVSPGRRRELRIDVREIGRAHV